MTASADLAALRRITAAVVDDSRPLWSLGEEVAVLAKLVDSRASFRIDPTKDISDGEKHSDHGWAVSPTQAAMCAQEVGRTAAFVRGLALAIAAKRVTVADRPVRVLYAGCGPYAMLAVPMMVLFSANEVQFVMLDLHTSSVVSARGIIESLGLHDYLAGTSSSDACEYFAPENAAPDLIVSETMNVALADDPLVTIACRLLNRYPHAELVPESVRVEAGLMVPSKEFVFHDPDHVGADPVPDRQREMLGTVFELNATNARQWGSHPGSSIPAAKAAIPAPLEPSIEVCLFTTVTVYGDVVLRDYDCSLTIPRPIHTEPPLQGGELLEFVYQLGERPGLKHQVVRNTS